VLYATTTESSTNRLIAITDTGANSPAMTLATAPSNTVFRGVAFMPESAPVITLQPQSQAACSGSTASFTSAAEGAPTLASQWQVSTNNGASFSDINGAHSANYGFTAGNGDNAERFRVIYSNNYGSVTSSVAALTVNSATASAFSLDAYKGASFKIAEADVLTHASGSGGVTLTSLDATSANGVSLTRTNGEILYNGVLAAADSFHYTVASATGNCAATALVTVLAVTNISPTAISVANEIPVLNFAVIPSFSYTVQRSTNLTTWDDLLTTNAPAGSGLFQYQDLAAPQPAAFYRLRYNP
jgi:hypothetical protein